MIAVFLISAPLPLQATKLTSENEGRLEKVRDGHRVLEEVDVSDYWQLVNFTWLIRETTK
jgi:hypothetical protein